MNIHNERIIFNAGSFKTRFIFCYSEGLGCGGLDTTTVRRYALVQNISKYKLYSLGKLVDSSASNLNFITSLPKTSYKNTKYSRPCHLVGFRVI